MNLNECLNEKINIIDDALHECMSHSDNPQSKIYDAMEYSLFAGGKRLRPVILLAVNEMCDGYRNDAVPFACAMEMIHTYSLIHDDLPSMDNDDIRRGRSTNHIKFGEAMAILAGDSLLNKAFEVMSNSKYERADSQTILKAIGVVAASSGTEGMIGGQVVDIESENKNIDAQQLNYLQSLKTGAIIRSSACVGAILAGANSEVVETVDKFALNLGIAFQIQDDILDVIGSVDELGKPIGSDVNCNKNTYTTIFGVEQSHELVEKYSKDAINSIKIFGDKAEFLIALTEYLISRRK